MMDRAILETVAMIDIVLCQIGSWPWGRIALSLALAAIIIYVVKAVVRT